jgi:hypothetical protein
MRQSGGATRHLPFDSDYRPNFEVLEQRDGPLTFFPRTDQLPLLLRALNLEFYNALPGYIARVDHRADGFHKIMRKEAALMFCSAFNAVRTDRLRLLELLDPDCVSRVTIVQQIVEDTTRGRLYRFRFYGGPDFFPEIRLSGRRVVFAEHVLQRFTQRVPNHIGADLSQLLLAFFGTPHIVMPLASGGALIVQYLESILAFPFKWNDKEFLITSCLTINEMNSLDRIAPPPALNLHYGEAFAVPRVRHWSPTSLMAELYKRWERKIPLPPPREPSDKRITWHWVADRIKDNVTEKGHGPGSQFFFLDHIPGPSYFELRPGEPEPRVNERDIYREHQPAVDWDAVFGKREREHLPNGDLEMAIGGDGI